MWGESWKKATGIMSYKLDLNPLEGHVCVGAKRGLCRRTGMPHFVLQGKAAQGGFRTKLAEAYPHKFALALARCFHNALAAKRASIFENYINSA